MTSRAAKRAIAHRVATHYREKQKTYKKKKDEK